jgi:hypothetical protein
MWYYLVKVVVSAILIVLISELAKRHSGIAALFAALPLTSLLAIIWMQVEGSPSAQIVGLCYQIFWLVIPSLLFFIVLPVLIKQGVAFWPSLACAVLVTILAYFSLLPLLRRLGVLS